MTIDFLSSSALNDAIYDNPEWCSRSTYIASTKDSWSVQEQENAAILGNLTLQVQKLTSQVEQLKAQVGQLNSQVEQLGNPVALPTEAQTHNSSVSEDKYLFVQSVDEVSKLDA